MAGEKSRKVVMIEDPNETAQALLRGVEVGLAPGGEMKGRIDRDLTPDELEALLDALPKVERKIRRRLAAARAGGRHGIH